MGYGSGRGEAVGENVKVWVRGEVLVEKLVG